MIERSHLAILRELQRQGSLTAAAKALHLTQSAISHSIKKLEAQAEVVLWQKQGRRIQLTQAGEFLLKEANRLLPQLERLDEVLHQHAKGDKGVLRIGMECYPCYRWLLKVVSPFLAQWPGVDIDVKQRFQFGGMAALFNYEIDLLVTPDPLQRPGVAFVPVLDYEQVLVVNQQHPLAGRLYVEPADLSNQLLYTYPVETARLDIFSQFLIPANCAPKQHKVVEDTDIMLQLVVAGRGVATLPRWLVAEYSNSLPLVPVRLGRRGLYKQIHLGTRSSDVPSRYTQAFLELALAQRAEA